MARAVVPQLTRDGWTSDPTTIMVKLFEYFLISEYSQTNTMYGDISSLKYLMEIEKDVYELRNVIIRTLDKLYGRYFKTVNVSVEINNDSETETLLLIEIDTVYANGEKYNLSNVIRETGGKIVNMDELMKKLREQ